MDIVQDASPDLLQRVVLAQLVETEIALCVRGASGGYFRGFPSFPWVLDLIAHFAQHPQEVLFRGRGADGPVDVGPDSAPVGGFPSRSACHSA